VTKLGKGIAVAAAGLWAALAGAQGADIGTQHAHVGAPALTIGGFADINYAAADQTSGSARDFRVGQLALHFNSALAPQTSFFGEVSLTPRSAGATSAQSFGVSVERLALRYDFSDALKLSAGRFHTPINWWNVAYHHGQWLQTSIARPEMTKFGGKFIPVHFVGALAEGALAAGGLNLNYRAGAGNGRGLDVHEAGDAGDSNTRLASLASLFVRPDALYDLQIGVAYYDDDVLLRSGSTFREGIASGYVVWLRETPEIIAEYAHVRHRDETSVAEFEHDAYYVQVGWRLPWSGERWKPYARYENLDAGPGDPVFAATVAPEPVTPAVTDRVSAIYGLRFDFIDYAALKAEYRRERIDTVSGVDGLHLQVCFAF